MERQARVYSCKSADYKQITSAGSLLFTTNRIKASSPFQMESQRESSESCLDQQGMKSIKLEWVYFLHASYFRFPLSL